MELKIVGRKVGMALAGMFFALQVAGGVPEAHAQFVAVSIDPNTVRVEQYAGNGPTVIWGYPYQATVPGGSCGNVQLPDDAPQGERSRLFGLFLMAKAARKPVTIHYYPDTCRLMAFAADGW